MAALAALAILAGGCNSTKIDSADLTQAEPPDVLYNQGLALLDEGDVRDAGEKFKEVDRQHPYSDYARRSMVMTAYLSYKRGQYQDAINDARRFVTLYPRHPDAAYAQYIIGESYFRQIPDVTRDQELSKLAIEAMNEVATKYPDSEYADDARRKVQIARDQMAGKEMQIGRYYLERGDYLAAVNRFKLVATEYQTTRHVEEALHRLVEAYLALGLTGEAQTAAAVLGHNFPDSEWYADSFALLGKSGAAPQENRGSWISRAFQRT
jgi:outer membrane protein assembly factor BamD